MTDTLAARVALRYQSPMAMSTITSVATSRRKKTSWRVLTLVWAPSDSVQGHGQLSHVDMDADGVEMTNPVVDRSLLAGMQAKTNMLGLTDDGHDCRAVRARLPSLERQQGIRFAVANEAYYPGGTDTESTKSTDVSVRVDWEIGDLTLTSLSAYSDFSFDQNHDVDFQSGNVVHALEEESHDPHSQEFRLSSDFEGRLNFVAGLYYEEQELERSADLCRWNPWRGIWPAAGQRTEPGAAAGAALGAWYEQSLEWTRAGRAESGVRAADRG
ncbi:MAG: hypothetical protein IPI75_02770 [Gammaproteobacteria bacterium]|nr:hypothetical protein [Gammaproteobacteria bacterium]